MHPLTMPLRLPLRLLPAVRTPAARHISFFGWGRKSDDPTAPTEATSSSQRSITDLLKHSPRTAAPPPASLTAPGSLDSSSIFGGDEPTETTIPGQLDLTETRRLRDPARSTWGWPKLAAAREARRRGRLSRPQRIARTEPEHTAASHFFKTSVKKLAPLARQIQGKSVEDAVVQMRFSAKKAAREVLAHLHHAKNEAVVRKGMRVPEMYVDQAWVGRGPFERGLNHRAKGRIDMLFLPYTSITLVLKEKGTLARIAKEKEAKRLRRPVRQHLPNRPLRGQRQYYSW
ncbi:ribosomal protein L22/L17 [Geopyxis carbonaria]|nr:ribosomal protein L22/L17 [Geopyxis carbonaria]